MLTAEKFITKIPEILKVVEESPFKDIAIFDSARDWNKEKLCFIVDDEKENSLMDLAELVQQIAELLRIDDVEELNIKGSYFYKEDFEKIEIKEKILLADFTKNDQLKKELVKFGYFQSISHNPNKKRLYENISDSDKTVAYNSKNIFSDKQNVESSKVKNISKNHKFSIRMKSHITLEEFISKIPKILLAVKEQGVFDCNNVFICKCSIFLEKDKINFMVLDTDNGSFAELGRLTGNILNILDIESDLIKIYIYESFENNLRDIIFSNRINIKDIENYNPTELSKYIPIFSLPESLPLKKRKNLFENLALDQKKAKIDQVVNKLLKVMEAEGIENESEKYQIIEILRQNIFESNQSIANLVS